MHLLVFCMVVLHHHKAADRVIPAMAVVGEWEFDFSGMYRPVGGYIDYTWYHLPARVNMPLPKSVVASPASLVARMARSSLFTRSRLK